MKAVEETETKMGVALVAAEAVDEAVAASKAVDMATAMATMVVVGKVTTTATKAHTVEAPRKNSSSNYYAYPPSVQPGQQDDVTGVSFHNAPVPSMVMVPMQMAPNVTPGQQGHSGNCAAPGGQSSIGMGSGYINFRG